MRKFCYVLHRHHVRAYRKSAYLVSLGSSQKNKEGTQTLVHRPMHTIAPPFLNKGITGKNGSTTITLPSFPLSGVIFPSPTGICSSDALNLDFVFVGSVLTENHNRKKSPFVDRAHFTFSRRDSPSASLHRHTYPISLCRTLRKGRMPFGNCAHCILPPPFGCLTMSSNYTVASMKSSPYLDSPPTTISIDHFSTQKNTLLGNYRDHTLALVISSHLSPLGAMSEEQGTSWRIHIVKCLSLLNL